MPPTSPPQVAILMGSDSDAATFEAATDVLHEFGVSFDVHVTSAHRTPERTLRIVREAEEAGVQVFIAGAGMAAHLAGVVAAHTTRPVLGVPMGGGGLGGIDALLATVQMPGGIPVATFAIGKAGAKNAALTAVAILALRSERLAEQLTAYRHAQATQVERRDVEVRRKLLRETE